MRAALLSRAVFPLHDPGGMERSVYHLATHLKRRGVDTVLFTRPATEAGSFPGEVVTVPYDRFPAGGHGRVLDRTLNYPGFAFRLGDAVATRVRAGEVDVVHAQGLSGVGYARHRRRDPSLRAPLILNPQGMEEHKTRGLKRLALFRVRSLSKETARLSDRVIATDEVTKDEVPRYLGVDAARVVVLPNGVDLAEIDAATPSDPGRVIAGLVPALGDASPVFLSVGRIERYKGFTDVLEALVRLDKDGGLPPKWAWVVLGEGTEKAALQARIAALHAAGTRFGPHVHFVGWVRKDPELHAYYARADVFVHATHYEGSSIVTLEAMAHALPVAATRTGGIPDKVTTGENGFLVEPGDVAGLALAIAPLAADADLRRRMGRAGRERVERDFSWRAIADRTIAVYEEMLRTRP